MIMKKTVNARLTSGMDSFLRAMGVIRRKEIYLHGISMSDDLLTITVREEDLDNVLAHLSKLADISVSA